MNLETTTCISLDHLDIIKRYAKFKKLSTSTFIINLINYVVSYKYIQTKAYTRLAYRSRYSSNWRRLHIVLLEHEYEFIMDVRKIYKMSLAKFIAYCIDNYLYDFLDALERDDNTDNYRCSGYTFHVFLEDGIQCCKFYWGPHPEILKKAASNALT